MSFVAGRGVVSQETSPGKWATVSFSKGEIVSIVRKQAKPTYFSVKRFVKSVKSNPRVVGWVRQ